jgi:hypothetical protein
LQDLSADTLTAITVAIVLVVSLGILIIRDRWRDHVGMPKGERKRLERSAWRWGMVFLFGLFGSFALLEFVLEFHSPERKRWGYEALILLSTASLIWVAGRRRKKDDG